MPSPRLKGRSSSPFKDLPSGDDDHLSNSGERDGMLPKNEFLVVRVPPRGAKCRRMISSLSTLAVLAIMALFLTFGRNRTRNLDRLNDQPPQVIPTVDTQFSGIPQAILPLSLRPLPTIPPEVHDEFSPESSNSSRVVRKAIVLASYKGQPVNWLENLPTYTKGWEVFRYLADDSGTSDSEALKVPSENGREAMAYLTFIIKNYHALPDYTVFTHGHDRAWHQPEHIIDKIVALNITALHKEGYINLRCSMSPGCTEETTFYFRPKKKKKDRRPGMLIEEGFWSHMMEKDFGQLPAVFGRRCCAQFAVSKRAIQARSLDFWKSLRLPLEGDMNSIRKIWGSRIEQYSLGSMYEQVWHILFGKDADFCPSKERCEKIHFSDIISCDGETTNFRKDKKKYKKIVCTNKIRHAIDSGIPLDEVVPDDPVLP